MTEVVLLPRTQMLEDLIDRFLDARARVHLLGATYRHAIRAGLYEVAPAIEAQALRSYADREHPHSKGVSYPTDYGTGIEYDAVCAGCDSSWDSDEGGCTERVALLKAADNLLAKP